jgi:DNA-binding CsgD family transcriptional regulator
VLRPLIILHFPHGVVRDWAEEVIAACRFTGNRQAVRGEQIHWAYMSNGILPPDWPVGKGRWVLTAKLASVQPNVPAEFVPAAMIPAFEDINRAAAALQAVASGWNLLPASPAVRQPARSGDQGDLPLLSKRELKVLEELVRGESNKSIAARLGMSESTARFHVGNIFRKLGAQNRAEAVYRAIARGLILI